MAPRASVSMSCHSTDRPLDDYQFTFESYLDDSVRIEPDSGAYGVYDTKSLSDSIANAREEYGRTYHSYRAGCRFSPSHNNLKAVPYPDHEQAYHFPNDPPENERVEEQYEILKMVMDGRLHISPFSRAQPPRKVLDIATGTGSWAIEMGDKYPEAEIIGTDLSPIQPAFVPPNVRFFIEDSYVFLPCRVVFRKLTCYEIGLMTGTDPYRQPDNLMTWAFGRDNHISTDSRYQSTNTKGLTRDRDYPADFDFIHTRVTIGCWSDMKKLIIQRAFDHLQPGGWLECQEVPCIIDCDDGTMPNDYGWLRWAKDLDAVGRLADRQVNVGPELKDWMREVGFVDIHETVFKIPVNGWPKEMRLKHVGMMWQRNLLEGLSGFSLGMFHRFMGKTVEEIELSLVDVRKSLFDRGVHAYHRLYVVSGRKPDAAWHPQQHS